MSGSILFYLRDCTESMTGIVYTDEVGQEQSLLGKLVYTTDETGSGNIILQVDSSAIFMRRVKYHNCEMFNFEMLDTDMV